MLYHLRTSNKAGFRLKISTFGNAACFILMLTVLQDPFYYLSLNQVLHVFGDTTTRGL